MMMMDRKGVKFIGNKHNTKFTHSHCRHLTLYISTRYWRPFIGDENNRKLQL